MSGPSIPDIPSLLDNFVSFVQSAMLVVDPLFIALFVGIGLIIGLILGWLFIGVGRTEQRLIGQSYSNGFRTGYNQGMREGRSIKGK